MDFNQFEWDIVERKSGFWRSMALRLLFLLPLAVGVGYAIIRFANSQKILRAIEVEVTLFCIELVFLAMILLLWHTLARARGPKLVHYRVSGEGVEAGRKKILLPALQTQDMDAVLDKHILPYAEWHQPRPADGKPLELTMVTNQGKMVLFFPEEYIRQKFIRTLKEYLHPQITS